MHTRDFSKARWCSRDRRYQDCGRGLYKQSIVIAAPARSVELPATRKFLGQVRLFQVSLSNARNNWLLPYGEDLSLDLTIDTKSDTGQFHVGIALHSVQGFEIASWTDKCSDVELPARHGMNTVRLAFPHLKLLPGHYYLDIGV